MGRRANSSLRDATQNAAELCDEIDAGWDEAPAHASMPPESASPAAHPESMIRELRPRTRRRNIGTVTVVGALGAAVAVVVAGVFSRPSATQVAPTASGVPSQAAKEATVQPPMPAQSAELAESATTVPSIEPLVLTPLVHRLPNGAREKAAKAAVTVEEGARAQVPVRRKRAPTAAARGKDSPLEEPSEHVNAAPPTAPAAASAAADTTAPSMLPESVPEAAPSPDRAGNEPRTD